MPLTKPNQQLRRDLKEAAALLKWSGVDIMQVAVRLSEAGFEDDASIAVSQQKVENKPAGWVNDGRISSNQGCKMTLKRRESCQTDFDQPETAKMWKCRLATQNFSPRY